MEEGEEDPETTIKSGKPFKNFCLFLLTDFDLAVVSSSVSTI